MLNAESTVLSLVPNAIVIVETQPARLRRCLCCLPCGATGGIGVGRPLPSFFARCRGPFAVLAHFGFPLHAAHGLIRMLGSGRAWSVKCWWRIRHRPGHRGNLPRARTNPHGHLAGCWRRRGPPRPFTTAMRRSTSSAGTFHYFWFSLGDRQMLESYPPPAALLNQTSTIGSRK